MSQEENNLAINNFNPLVTEEDKTGTDLLEMSDFFDISEKISSIELSSDSIQSFPIADLSLINEALIQGNIMLGKDTILIPDLDSLPIDVKQKLKKGIYKIGESKQIDNNFRATIVDTLNHNERVKDITLKKVKSTSGSIESLRSISIQIQLKQISSSLENLLTLSMYQIERDRDNNIIVPFQNAREYILKAQNCKDTAKKIEYLKDADKYMISGFNSIYTDMKTSSKYLAIFERIPFTTKFVNAYMYYLQYDMILATKMLGLRQNILYCLEEYSTMKDAINSYRANMNILLNQPIGRRNKTAIELMQDNYPYTKKNRDLWLKFPSKVETFLQNKEIETDKSTYILTVE